MTRVTVLWVALPKKELAHLIPGYPFVDLYHPKQRADGSSVAAQAVRILQIAWCSFFFVRLHV